MIIEEVCNLIDLMNIYQIVTVVLAIVTCYLAYRQLKAQKTVRVASEYIKIHDKIMVLSSREKTVELLSEITNKAKKGEIVFGHCRICTGYPKEFFISLSEAVSRGVKFQSIVSERPESKEFRDFLLGLDPNYVEVRRPTEELYASVYGIKGKEVLFMYHMIDESIGVHYRDPMTTKYIDTAFDVIWDDAEKISRGKEHE